MAEDADHLRVQFIKTLVENAFSREFTQPKVVGVPSEDINIVVTGLLTKVIDKALTHFEERLKSYCSELSETDAALSDEESLKISINKFWYFEDYLMQTYRNKAAEGSRIDSKGLKDESSSREIIYPETVLTTFQNQFLQDVNLDGTDIMDRLVVDRIMTDDERESIVQEKTCRRRKEAFLSLMKGRLSHDALINNFIPAIEQDHPDVAKKLTQEIGANISVSPVCAVCKMKETIQVKHLADYLHTNRIISSNLYEEFRISRSNNSSKWSALLSNVSNPGFITEAVQSNFPVVYEWLKSSKSTNLQCTCFEIEEAEAFQDERTATEGTADVANIGDLESLLERSVLTTSAISFKSLEEYKMSSRKRGRAVLINNKTSNPDKYIQRFYDLDTKKLADILSEKGFQTEVFTNLSGKQVKSDLQRTANLNHEEADAFVCVIHCELENRNKNGILLDANGEAFFFKELKDMFTATRCPTLAGKPKVFLLPSGVRRKLMEGNANVPNEADFLTVRATAPGYGVWVDDEYSGSLWVKVFNNVFKQYSETLDIVSLLTLVANRVSLYSNGPADIYKQSPHVESTLRNLLFFRSQETYEQEQTVPKSAIA